MVSVLCGRLLGKQGLGELGMVRNTVLLLAAVAGTGLATAVTKHVAEFRHGNLAKLGRLIGLSNSISMAIGCLMALLCYCLTVPITDIALNARHLDFPLRIASFLVPFQMLQAMQTAILSGFEAFRKLAIIIMMDAVFLVVLVPTGILLSGINGAIVGYVVVATVGCFTRYFALASECRRYAITIRRELSYEDLSVLWRGATPLVVLWIVWQAADWLARLPLTHQVGGYANLGIFTAALSWSSLVIFLPQQLSAPNFPILASLFGAGDSRGFIRTVQTVWLACAGLSIITAIPLIILSKHILGLYGAEYWDGWPVMTLLTLTFAVNGAARVPAHVLIVAGHTWLHCLFTFFWGAMLCIIAILLREYGATGLAVAYFTAHVAYLLLHSTACLRVLHRVHQRNSLHASS